LGGSKTGACEKGARDAAENLGSTENTIAVIHTETHLGALTSRKSLRATTSTTTHITVQDGFLKAACPDRQEAYCPLQQASVRPYGFSTMPMAAEMSDR